MLMEVPHKFGYILATTIVASSFPRKIVSIQQGGNETGILTQETRIERGIPMWANAVGAMQSCVWVIVSPNRLVCEARAQTDSSASSVSKVRLPAFL
jgi:hypothetical protein